MNIQKTEQLYEGKAKKVYATNDPDLVIVDYKDDATAFNGEKKGTIVGKGAINNKMTNYMLKLLETGKPLSRRWKSFPWRLSSETWQQAAFPRSWALQRVHL